MKRKKPYPYLARRKPFRLELDFKHGAVVTGFWDVKNDTVSRYTRGIPIVKGSVFYHDPKRGLILNGKPVPVKLMPPKKVDARIGWAPKRLRIAVFYEKGNPGCWLAADTRSYWVAQGKTALDAVKSLLLYIRAMNEEAKRCRRKGLKVIRWHVERVEGASQELRKMEEQARKTGMILEGVDWRESAFAKNLVKMVGS